MIVLLDTSTPECHLSLLDTDGEAHRLSWQADRSLADKLLDFIVDALKQRNTTLHDIAGIGLMQGPGSFTGLRIGMTVANTIAGELHIPIVGATGESWENVAIQRLKSGESDKIVLPLYGRSPNITKRRK